MANSRSRDKSELPERFKDVFIAYHKAKEAVIAAGFERELYWQSNVDFDEIKETDFLQEYAWVVLSSGMKESVVRRIFTSFSVAFCKWESSLMITSRSQSCRVSALRIFNNRKKVESIINTAQLIADMGFEEFRESLKKETMKTLLSLDFIGPITCYHLAKNLGLDVAKPDRHLTRIAHIFGYADVQELCNEVSRRTGDKVSVVDLVFWRFAVITPSYRSALIDFASI